MERLPEVVRAARTQLVVGHPFFGSIALRLRWATHPDVRTMATDGRHIFFDPAWCETIGVAHVMGVAAHEVLHVANRHHLRMHGRDRRLWNVATDLVINRLLVEAGFSLPDDLLHDHERHHAGLTAEAVYDRLLAETRESGEDGPPEPGWGQVVEPTGDHGQALSPASRSAAEGEVDVMVRQAMAMGRRAGRMPASVALHVEAASDRTDWRDRFRLLADGWRRNGLSWSRPNRRFLPHGLFLPCLERRGVGRIAVVLDTSGSISATELATYAGAVRAMLEEAEPEEIVLIECDAEVQHVQHLTTADGLDRIEVHGRGGTLFQPAFDWLAQHAPDIRAIVYMTDLMSADQPVDPGLPVIWLTPTLGRDGPFGETVRIRP